MIRYVGSDEDDVPVESHLAVALTVRGLTGGMQDEHRAARQLIADLAKVGVVIGDMRAWRREFLRGHVAGENEDHRLAGIIADQADEIDRLGTEHGYAIREIRGLRDVEDAAAALLCARPGAPADDARLALLAALEAMPGHRATPAPTSDGEA